MTNLGYPGGGAKPAAEVWNVVRAALKREFDGPSFASYLEPASLYEGQDGALCVATKTATARDWVRREAWRRLVQLWSEQDRRGANLMLKSAAELDGGQPITVAASLQSSSQAAPSTETRAPSTLPSGLQGRFTFDNFVVGTANDFAYEVARKVGEWDEATFNPVVLHGTYGFGKTHLLNAAAIEAKRLRPDASVVYLTAERFLNTFLQAVRGRATGDFKDEIRAADLLLIDDVHLVGGKPATQEEMFHTLSAVLAGGGRVMLSADRPPQALEEVDARLRSLLTSGLLCGIEPADRELRLGIIQCKLAELRRLGRIPATQVRPEVMEYLADRFSSSVRELEGALNTLVLRAGARLADISRDDANEMLAPHLRVTERRITVDDIQRAVSERFSLSRADLLSPRRTQSVARPRQIGMWLCKQLTSRSLPDIGRRFGGKDHTTVLHAIRRIDELRGADPQIMADSDALMRQLRG